MGADGWKSRYRLEKLKDIESEFVACIYKDVMMKLIILLR